MVPRLTTALTGPLLDLERRILREAAAIEHWFRQNWQEHTPPFYCSVDLRNAGFKLAPVDTNLFPAGFNNLNPAFAPLCVQAVMAAIEQICPDAHRLLLIPENHTRNTFYLQNVAQLASLIRQAGLSVRIGSVAPEIDRPTSIDLPNGAKLLLEPVRRAGRRVMVDGFDPCAVLLNNDLSAGVPAVLSDLHEQTVIPPLHAGWTTRRKTHHFNAYNAVAEQLADLLGIDPWLINPYFATCGKIDFSAKQGEDCLAGYVEELLAWVGAKYREYKIDASPFLIVKADAGTYGMGIMTVKSVDDVRNLNRKQRNKMAVVKEGLAVHEVLVQEGVYTFETVEDAVAEPVVYMIDRFVVGGFYRVHTARGTDENLNAPGSRFVPLEFAAPCSTPDPESSPDCPPNRFYAYGVIARCALLAAARELEEMAAAVPNQEPVAA
jgi:glutamate--cysteine ligase